jgi:hypothetical protein
MDHSHPAAGGDDALVGQAIETLTALARQTRIRGRGTPAAATEPVDFADLAAHVITSVAANLGSVGTLLAGRPGSWEADVVRKLVEGTAGYDGELVSWRTEPVRLHITAEDILYDFGISDLFDAECDQAADRTSDEALTDEQRAAAETVVEAMEQLWEADQAAYAEAYRATALRYLTERGATCGVELVSTPAENGETAWDGLAVQIDEYARAHTPLPMTGSAPDWTDGLPAEALRRGGLAYTARAEAQMAAEGRDGHP